jgi:hypothetical protein
MSLRVLVVVLLAIILVPVFVALAVAWSELKSQRTRFASGVAGVILGARNANRVRRRTQFGSTPSRPAIAATDSTRPLSRSSAHWRPRAIALMSVR